MELWIRSQDKEILVKVNNLSLALNNDETCEIINSFEDHQCWELGVYKTKERTLEVLDEIQHKLITLCDSMNRKLYVYEMPEE